MTAAATPPPARTRRWRKRLAFCFLALLLALLALRFLLPPRIAIDLVLQQTGKALGLEIRHRGESRYVLNPRPALLLRDLDIRQPGSASPILVARRLYLALPWRTLRQRGKSADIERIELDSPRLDLAALSAWQASRPPAGESPVPMLEKGLQIRDGHLVGAGWSLQAIELHLPRLQSGHPLAMRMAARYRQGEHSLPFRLNLALDRLSDNAALGLVAEIDADPALPPARLVLSAPSRWQAGQLRLQPARLRASMHLPGTPPAPIGLGLHGPVQISAAGIHAPDLALALRGQGPVPQLDARGHLALASTLAITLQGQLARWPESWPALPAPIGTSQSPLPLALQYRGPMDFSAALALKLQRDDSHFDGQLHLPRLLDWLENGTSPLPPVQGQIHSPRLEIEGILLEDIDIRLDDTATP